MAYILSVLNEKIEESTAATIKIDVPLYEQCPTVSCKFSDECTYSEDEYCEIQQDLINKNICLNKISQIIKESFYDSDIKKQLEILKARFFHIDVLVKQALGEEKKCQ